jgi:uncharacterized protein YndB with AHSA1/START domain
MEPMRRLSPRPSLAAACCAILSASTAFAEVKAVGPDGFLSQHVLAIQAPAPRVWAALGTVGAWWNPAHSWSRSAANLSIDLTAGGCFCERWPDGAVEHGRVIMARPNQVLRLAAPLGPLQELGVNAILTWMLTQDGDATRLTVTYRVSGDSLHALAALAPAVDGVIGEQAARLKAFVERPPR